jgi:TatA/E family protein of Tat protein translocase
MFNLGPFELLAILVVALLVFGPEKLPEIGKQVGKAMREFKKFQASMQDNVRDVIEPITGPIIPNGPGGGQFGNPTPTNISGGNIPRSATIQNPEPSNGEAAAPPGTFGHYGPVEPPAAPAESAPVAPAAPAESAPAAPAAPAESADPAPRPATPADGPPQATGWALPAEPSPPPSPAEPDAG